MRALYSLNIFFYGIAIRIASLFNAKAKLWVSGRRKWEDVLRKKLSGNTSKIVWFHCASLGEFEQGRPVMERFRKENPGWKILLTFFSPSGYEVRKNYAGADIICYLPLDTKSNARKFVGIVSPSLIYFVKYEFWLNFLAEFRKRNIPHYLFSAIFRDDQIFFKGHGKIFRNALKGFEMIFTQEEHSVKLLSSIGVKSIAAGDTRFDRVTEIAATAKEIPIAASFAKHHPTLIAGSTWPADEELLFHAVAGMIKPGRFNMIIAPHELGEKHLISIEKILQEKGIGPVIRFSKATEDSAANAMVLLVDNIGMLSSLYRYGQLAYIGGGFGKSIHNTLEAAVFGIPVVFGPRFEKFNEAKGLIECRGGFSASNGNDLKKIMFELMWDEKKMWSAGWSAGKYVSENKGATEKILSGSSSSINR